MPLEAMCGGGKWRNLSIERRRGCHHLIFILVVFEPKRLKKDRWSASQERAGELIYFGCIVNPMCTEMT
jgi:hypothetical protein